MKKRRTVFLVAALCLAFLLAVPLRGLVQEIIIIPLARFFWMVKGYYGAFDQVVYWFAALAIALVIAAGSFRLPDWDWRAREKSHRVQGEVHNLAFWIQRIRSDSDYPSWYVAHLLAKLAFDLRERRGVRKGEQRLKGAGWDPPPDVQKYLESALTSTYVNFSRLDMPTDPAGPLEKSVEPAIAYLESFLEKIPGERA